MNIILNVPISSVPKGMVMAAWARSKVINTKSVFANADSVLQMRTACLTGESAA